MLLLVEPSLTYKDPCLDAVREFHAAGEYSIDAEQMRYWINLDKTASPA